MINFLRFFLKIYYKYKSLKFWLIGRGNKKWLLFIDSFLVDELFKYLFKVKIRLFYDLNRIIELKEIFIFLGLRE